MKTLRNEDDDKINVTLLFEVYWAFALTWLKVIESLIGVEICVVEAVAYLLVALQVGGGRMVLVGEVMLLSAADPDHQGRGDWAEQPASGEEAVHSSITDDELDSIESLLRVQPSGMFSKFRPRRVRQGILFFLIVYKLFNQWKKCVFNGKLGFSAARFSVPGFPFMIFHSTLFLLLLFPLHVFPF